MKETIKEARIFRLLACFSKREHTAFQKFLHSPYFNQRQDVIDLYQALLSHIDKDIVPSKVAIWAAVYPDTSYQDQQLRLCMSYLSRLVEQFLAVEALSPFAKKLNTAESLLQRGEDQLYQQFLQDAKRTLDRQTTRNYQYLFHQYELKEAFYHQAYTRQPDRNDDFQSVSRALDTAFLAHKLRQNCLLLAHEQVYQWGYQPTRLDHFIAQLGVADLQDQPALLVYWHCWQMLQQPNDTAAFLAFKDQLLRYSSLFPTSEARDLFLMAINNRIRQINDSQDVGYDDILELYKDGLEAGYLLRNGKLSRFTYHNIIGIALKNGDITWSEQFIEKWTDALERRFRDRMYHHSRAKIAYTAKNYDQALELLQQSNYHDPLLNLGARTLLLKIYYELKEWDVLQSHLDAFQSYLRRKPELGYHRTNYRNLIKYTRRILTLPPTDTDKRQVLVTDIKSEEVLTERDWLIAQIRG